jgi:hypothetical protein
MKVRDHRRQLFERGGSMKWIVLASVLAACGGGAKKTVGDGGIDAAIGPDGGSSPVVGGCPVFPASFIFNTPIDTLPVDPNSDAYIASIGGTGKLHLDLGTQTDPTASDFYGIPYNLVHGGSFTWPSVDYSNGVLDESDCADASRSVLSPCPATPGHLPIPSAPVIEGPSDSHLLVIDQDTCRLWESDATTMSGGQWSVYSSASWDLHSSALRPADWTSADAAGFPILPLLLRADEASSGTIAHAVRFTVVTSRTSYVWPARHEAGSTSSTSVPPMGQLFRLKASYQIPASFGTQSRAILQALKTYGMYVADNGSNWFIQGEPSASWADATFTEVQSVPGSEFEAVDITAIMSRSGFDPNSGAVPAP